ncbi:MAG: hypothetical protein P4N59_17430 [Negativicutes bacterium]|nr:hypothetical protein [Negativicutes bacterium]
MANQGQAGSAILYGQSIDWWQTIISRELPAVDTAISNTKLSRWFFLAVPGVSLFLANKFNSRTWRYAGLLLALTGTIAYYYLVAQNHPATEMMRIANTYL